MLPLVLLRTAEKHAVVSLTHGPQASQRQLRLLLHDTVHTAPQNRLYMTQLVELKNGETYNGHMVQCDSWMNVRLREVICTSKVRQCHRGSVIPSALCQVLMLLTPRRSPGAGSWLSCQCIMHNQLDVCRMVIASGAYQRRTSVETQLNTCGCLMRCPSLPTASCIPLSFWLLPVQQSTERASCSN